MLLGKFKKLIETVILSSVLLASVATATGTTLIDPYETYNRSAYRFNKTLDQILLKPVATVYDKSLPAPLKKGVINFFDNIGEVPNVANNLLQANIGYAVSGTWRFLFNSTLGIFGLFDVASYFGIPKYPTDFGITLRKWGIRPTPYLVLPILGPSTVSNTLAKPVDFQLSLYPYVENHLAYSSLGLNMVAQRAEYLKYGSSDDIALDPYLLQRNAYLQRRAELLNRAQGKSADDLTTDYEFAD